MRGFPEAFLMDAWRLVVWTILSKGDKTLISPIVPSEILIFCPSREAERGIFSDFWIFPYASKTRLGLASFLRSMSWVVIASVLSDCAMIFSA